MKPKAPKWMPGWTTNLGKKFVTMANEYFVKMPEERDEP